jgi:capsular polysaccharide biosynthesis protein
MRTNYSEKKFSRSLPENVREKDIIHFQKILSYTCPALVIYQFRSVNILPDGTLFKGIFPLNISFPFFRRRLKHHNRKGIASIRLKWKKKKLEANNPTVIIFDTWTKNYYHWITQALPRLLLAQQTNQQFTLLLPQDHQSEFHKASLKLLQVDSWQTIERKNQYYDVRNLWYPSHDIQIGDYNDDLITLLRDKLSKVEPQSELQKKRLFIKRASKERRNIVNEDDVLKTFLSFDFEIVDFEQHSFEEQILLAGKASVLAGVHGAGLTNMIFMPAHSTVFELTTRINGEHYYYYSLSNALTHRYYYQVCDPDQEVEVQEANLMVDIDTLKENITRMLSE